MQKIPKLISSTSAYKNSFQEIRVDVLGIDGKKWEQVYFVKPNKNGVGVLPVDERGIYLVNQYRHASSAFLWQIPMGMMEKGSSELQTAKAELLEEAGLEAREFIKIGSLFPEPGMSNQEEFIFVAKGLTSIGQQPEDTEIGIQVKHFTFEEIEQMIKTGEIKCGFTLSALYLFRNNHERSY